MIRPLLTINDKSHPLYPYLLVFRGAIRIILIFLKKIPYRICVYGSFDSDSIDKPLCFIGLRDERRNVLNDHFTFKGFFENADVIFPIDIFQKIMTRRSYMETLQKSDIATIWEHYFEYHDIQSRNILLEHYLHLVKYTAERLHARFPRFVDVEDLYSAGIFGLLGAIKNFKPTQNAKFETYGVQRIQGAIRDYIRKTDWVPRLVRCRAHQLHNATQKLEAFLGRLPADTELADELGMDMDRFYHFQRDANAVVLISLNMNMSESDDDEEFSELYAVFDPKSRNPYYEVHKQDFQEFIKKGLSREDQLIVILYYYEQMTMKEIGDVLGLSESRICQMHSSILAKLKGQLNASLLCLQ